MPDPDYRSQPAHPAAPPPLPANYIDPEHQGEALELLQTFYQACNAEGGTADEIHLRGLRAVLAAHPAAPPAPDHVNLIGFAFGREPWATWLRQGGCLESAHCELSDLMLAVLAKWGRPAAPPAPEPGEVGELVARLRNRDRWTQLTDAQVDRAATLLQLLPFHAIPLPQAGEGEV
jgi:hypothetical protein